MTGFEIAGTLLKPVYYEFRIVRGLVTGRKDTSGFRVPRKTLILLPLNTSPPTGASRGAATLTWCKSAARREP
jgi:hypothetical protein